MGVDLLGGATTGEFACNWVLWWKLLQLASEYGWKPAGTLETTLARPRRVEEPQWEGGYLSSDGQRVTAEDAAALAAALGKALRRRDLRGLDPLLVRRFIAFCGAEFAVY